MLVGEEVVVVEVEVVEREIGIVVRSVVSEDNDAGVFVGNNVVEVRLDVGDDELLEAKVVSEEVRLVEGREVATEDMVDLEVVVRSDVIVEEAVEVFGLVVMVEELVVKLLEVLEAANS